MGRGTAVVGSVFAVAEGVTFFACVCFFRFAVLTRFGRTGGRVGRGLLLCLLFRTASDAYCLFFAAWRWLCGGFGCFCDRPPESVLVVMVVLLSISISVRTKPLQVMLDTPLCIANSNVSFVHVCWLGFLSILTQGFLLKRRETGNWQKRWCVLTERNMEYYHSRQVRSSFMVRYGKRCWGGKRGLWCGMRCVVLYRVVAWHRSTV